MSVAMIFASVLSGSIVSAHAEPRQVRTATRNESGGRKSSMRISIKLGAKLITAGLVDSATSRDFVSLLPMTIELEDYAATEKIGYLPRKLSTVVAPAGTDPATEDVTYYAPWGNLRLFHKDFQYSSGLIPLGKIESGLDAPREPGSVTAAIELTN
jgi:hypothetical protein